MYARFETSVAPAVLDRFYRVSGMYYFDRYKRVLVALEGDDKDLFDHPPLLLSLLRFKAVSLQNMGELTLALHELGRFKSLEPEDGWLRKASDSFRADVDTAVEGLRDRRLWPELIALCDAAIDVLGPWPEMAWQQAVALDEVGRPAEAEPILRDLVTLVPLGESYWHSLALVVAHQGRFDDARQVGQEAVATLRSGGRTPEDYEWIDRMQAARGGATPTQLALIN